MENEILDQLKKRPKGIKIYSDNPLRQKIADILAESIRAEKRLDYVTLHPDDPAVLLLWGWFDDLTPSVFTKGLRSTFGVEIAWWENCFEKGLSEKTTVAKLVEFCAHSIDRRGVERQLS
jgi:hypothetical protein